MKTDAAPQDRAEIPAFDIASVGVPIVGRSAYEVWRQVTVHACSLVSETVVRRKRGRGLHHRPGLPVVIDFSLEIAP